jgi:hypothetical protein
MCKELFLNGDIYFGEYKDGVRNGKGKEILSNGCIYVGEWKEGIIVKNDKKK